MPILMFGKGLATVIGAAMMLLGKVLGAQPDTAPVAPMVEEIGEYVAGFGLLRKGGIDWNPFGKAR